MIFEMTTDEVTNLLKIHHDRPQLMSFDSVCIMYSRNLVRPALLVHFKPFWSATNKLERKLKEIIPHLWLSHFHFRKTSRSNKQIKSKLFRHT